MRRENGHERVVRSCFIVFYFIIQNRQNIGKFHKIIIPNCKKALFFTKILTLDNWVV